MIPLRPIQSIVVREFKRFFRQRGRLLSALARPLLWLFLLGTGITPFVDAPAGVSYLQFLSPGVLGMVVLFSSIHSALSTVYDREFGVMRLILVAPISRLTIVSAKVASGSLLSLFQAAILLCLAPLIGLPFGLGQIPPLPGEAMPLGPDFPLASNLGVLVAFSAVTIAAATSLFDKEARLVRLAARYPPFVGSVKQN